MDQVLRPFKDTYFQDSQGHFNCVFFGAAFHSIYTMKTTICASWIVFLLSGKTFVCNLWPRFGCFALSIEVLLIAAFLFIVHAQGIVNNKI